MRTTTRHPICARLRQSISPCDHGIKLPDGRVVHANTNERVVRAYSSHGWVRGLSNGEMLRHFAGELTVYFTAAGRLETPEVLLMVDIDCHKAGTYEAAVAFAEHIRDHDFPSLYFEISTNGNGVHAYIHLDKRGFGDARTHALYGMLDRAIKGIHADWQARNPGLIVEMVEVKGHPPRFHRDRHGKVASYTSGQLAKLPREVDRRWDEFRKTTRVDERRVIDLHRRWKVQVATGEKKAATAKPGSITGHVVGMEALDLFDAYLGLAGRSLPVPLKTTGREIATAEDLAILLMILEACTLRMNPDGSMPTARIKKNWDVLHEVGAVLRPFNPKRYAVLRNHLSREKLIDWEDESFLPHQLSQQGIGRAAKWRASERLMEMIEEARPSVKIEVKCRKSGDGVREQGDREKREHLYSDSHDHNPFDRKEVGPREGNDPFRTRDWVAKWDEEDPFGGNTNLRLRESRKLRYPRPVLRVSSSRRIAA